MPYALYIVRPLPTGHYELTGPTLPYPLRFKDDAAPLNHAHFCGRGQTGKAIVLSRSGAVLFAERLAGPVARAGGRCRVDAGDVTCHNAYQHARDEILAHRKGRHEFSETGGTLFRSRKGA